MTKPIIETTEETREERIRMRAYEIWCEEGQPPGRDVENWIKACDEIEADLRKAAGLEPKKPAAAKPAAAGARPKVAKAAKPASAVLHS